MSDCIVLGLGATAIAAKGFEHRIYQERKVWDKKAADLEMEYQEELKARVVHRTHLCRSMS